MSDDEEPFEDDAFIWIRDDIEVAQCTVCWSAVPADSVLQHSEWHASQSNVQTHIDVAIATFWKQVRDPDKVREIVEQAISGHDEKLAALIKDGP